MESEEYVKLKRVEELIELFDCRVTFYEWTDDYAMYNKKIDEAITSLRRNTRLIN